MPRAEDWQLSALRPQSWATQDCIGAICETAPVVTDGVITTSRGVGTAIPFALSLIAQLYGQEKADEIAKSIVYEV